MVNVPELRKVLEFISSNPEKHHQGHWFIGNIPEGQRERIEVPKPKYHVTVAKDVWSCQTAGCLAGWAAAFAGWQYVTGTDGEMFRKDVGTRQAADVAQQALCLNEDEATKLFDPDNSVKDLWRLANKFTDGEIEIPAEYTEESDVTW